MGKVRTAKAKALGEAMKETQKRRRLLLEVRQEAAEFAKGLRRNIDPADGVQTILDNMMTQYEYATQQVMTLDEDEYWEMTITGKKLNHWIVEQERLGLQIVHVAGKAASMGLAERQVRLQEQQAAIFATIVEAALVHAGLNADQRRSIHEGISSRLEDIEGTASEVATVPALNA